jgi:hypothetical protein
MADTISSVSRGNLEAVSTGATAEAIAGAAALVLTILGLSHMAPQLMAAIATVVIGGGLLLEGVAIGARVDRIAPLHNRERAELASGMSAEFVAGVAGIALGILAIAGIYPTLLLAVATLVFGVGLLVGSASLSRLNWASEPAEAIADETLRAARYAVSAAAGAQTLVALAATVLGILALLGFAPGVLSLIALLAIGGSLLLSGGAVSGKVLKLLHRA